MRNKGHTYVFKTTQDTPDKEYFREGVGVEYGFFPEEVDHQEDIYEWIRGIYIDSRGIELPGFINPQVLQIIFCKQSTSWKDIATDYVDSAISELQNFNKALLEVLVSDQSVRDNIQNMFELQSDGKCTYDLNFFDCFFSPIDSSLNYD